MDMKRLFSLKGMNVWYLASAIALNMFWALGLAVLLSLLLLKQVEGGTGLVQVGLIAVAFLAPLVIAWIIGSIAADGRGPTYGVYGALGSSILLLIMAVPSTGLLGLMMIVVALAGGFNGGMLTVRRKIEK